MRKKFLNQPQHIIKSQRHAHNVFLEGERSNKNTAVLSPKKKILSQINAEIFMLKKRELIKNADSRSTAAKLKVQPKKDKLCGRQKRADPHKIKQRQTQCNSLNAPISPPTELRNLRFEPTLQDA